MVRFEVVAPGRVCLFGEHSDYLGLPIIAAAIDLTIRIGIRPTSEAEVVIEYRDTGNTDRFPIDQEVSYLHSRDYLRSAFNNLYRHNIRLTSGLRLDVTGTIPMAGGLSSSSALTVASICAFATSAGVALSDDDMAVAAYEAEVREFGESGGMMDHYASVFGNLIHLDPEGLTRLQPDIAGLVIGDSGEPKANTVGDLASIRRSAEEGYRILGGKIPGFDQLHTPLEDVISRMDDLPERCRLTTLTTIRNREITKEARELLLTPRPDLKHLGDLINRHHVLLRDGLNRSTPKIERMIDAALEAGALGCKINGSGGGGTMLALAPGREEDVVDALRSVGAESFVVGIDEGCRVREVS